MEYKFKAWQPFEGYQTIAIEDDFHAIMWGLDHQVDIFTQDNKLVYSPNDDEESNFERLEKYGVKCIDNENGRTWERELPEELIELYCDKCKQQIDYRKIRLHHFSGNVNGIYNGHIHICEPCREDLNLQLIDIRL